jgi:7,8-dihydroneopterin aldolase/epimerase/oxygenase
MDTIVIRDLAVAYHVGVTEAERAHAQRLLLSLEISHDFERAVALDDLSHTIDYFAVCQRLLRYGEGRQWQLIETLASELAAMLNSEFRVTAVVVEIKKFVIPEAAHVAVRVIRKFR